MERAAWTTDRACRQLCPAHLAGGTGEGACPLQPGHLAQDWTDVSAQNRAGNSDRRSRCCAFPIYVATMSPPSLRQNSGCMQINRLRHAEAFPWAWIHKLDYSIMKTTVIEKVNSPVSQLRTEGRISKHYERLLSITNVNMDGQPLQTLLVPCHAIWSGLTFGRPAQLFVAHVKSAVRRQADPRPARNLPLAW